MTLPNDDPKVLARRNQALPTTYCTIMNSSYASCDDCKRKVAIRYNGEDWFCIAKVVELRFQTEMLESKRNLQMGWSTNYLLEFKREKDDNDEISPASGNIIQPTDGQPVDQMGVDGEGSQSGSGEVVRETEEIVGECCGI